MTIVRNTFNAAMMSAAAHRATILRGLHGFCFVLFCVTFLDRKSKRGKWAEGHPQPPRSGRGAVSPGLPLDFGASGRRPSPPQVSAH